MRFGERVDKLAILSISFFLAPHKKSTPFVCSFIFFRILVRPTLIVFTLRLRIKAISLERNRV